MSIKTYFLTNPGASYWVGQAKAYRTAASWVHLGPQPVKSFRGLMRMAAIYAAQDAKWARQRAQTEAKFAAALGGAK